MKMFALRGVWGGEEMELPGGFFVDSMDVALPHEMGLRMRMRSCYQQGLGPLLQPHSGSCHSGDHWGPLGTIGTKGSFLHFPGEQDQAPLPTPGVMGATQGDAGLQHQLPWSSSNRQHLQLCHRSNLGRISFILTLKCSRHVSKFKIKPKRAA